jgi:hypothetical protein
MHSRPLRFVSPRRFGWLLWLALLLPMAQATAACHALSHLRDASTSESEGKRSVHAKHCDLCLIGAAIAGGAPLGDLAPLTHPALGHEASAADVVDVWLAAPARAYRSRAPPLASL